jgi:hypothetical protein
LNPLYEVVKASVRDGAVAGATWNKKKVGVQRSVNVRQ